jgi:hypothetical protein
LLDGDSQMSIPPAPSCAAITYGPTDCPINELPLSVAVLFAAFGLPRLVAPDRSIRLQQRLYPRRVHGVVLLMGSAGLWIASRLVHR